ncbi:MAG: ATP-binding protein, partial [Clostridia bacterium]|nr:ATP-binding protein [Clostridia bacterium]
THLACSVANELMTRGKPVVCLTAVEVLRNAKKHFDQRSDRDPVDAYCAVPLMIIDDLGKTQHTDWALETLFAIIDKRYKDCLPTVVTANYGPDGLVEAMKSPKGDTLTARTIVDRLREMCFTVELRGTSHRA